MTTIDIKDIYGQVRFSTPINKGAKGKFTLMKEDYIILPFSVPSPIPFKLGDYVDLAGVLDDSLGGKLAKIYEIVDLQKPTHNTSTGGYDYELRLDAYYWKWKNKIFKYTPEQAGSEASWSLTAALDVQLGVFLRNLKALGYTYRGTNFTFSIDDTVENKAVAMTYDNMNLLDALFSMAGEDKWNCDCWITDNVIHFGRNEFGDAVKIERGVEASSITRSESQGTYATRIYAFGSTRNIPTSYRPTDEQAVINGVVQKRLMLPADTPYIDAYEGMSQEEAIEDVVVFDDVYPRRIGTLSDVHTRTEEVENEDGTKETVTYYRYKDTGLEFKEEYIIEGQELQITFQSGKLNGMVFGVIFNPTPKDETRGEQLWEIVRNEDYGRPLPDDTICPENGDQYILSGFDIQLVSDQYIPAAEQELKEKAQKYADKVKKDDGTYPTTLMSTWVHEDPISRTFEFGQRINLVDDTYFENGRISRVLGWEMNLDIPCDSPVYTIGESMPYSRISEIEDKVDALTYKGQTYTGVGGSGVYVIKTNDSTAPSDSNVFSALRSLSMFLRKDQEDSTYFLVKFLAGIVAKYVKSETFNTGALGSGYFLGKDENGDSYLEVDRMLVRKVATFVQLLIQKLRYVGGQIILTPASMSCSMVEEHDTFYRCYFENTDGEKTIAQEFVEGDQARCQTFNIKEGVSENVSNTYYWRLVVGTGDNYIDLSKTDCDAGSTVPQAGDDIVLLGNRTDATRQAATILSAYGNDAPYAKMYRGIHSYNMSEAEEFFSASRTELHIIANRILMSTTGKDVETSISDAQLLAAALSKGTMMFTNPTFKNLAGQRYNKMGAYNSAIVQWVTDDSIGNDSGIGVRVTLRNNGRNGFFWNVPGGANYEYLAYFVAKIPIGLTAAHTAQANSELDAHWLTTNKGTGQWKEYACHIKYRSTPKHDQINGEFGRCCYFSFSGTVEYPAEILIRYATVYRLNSYTLYATDSYVRSQFEITNDKIESSVESVSSSTNAYSLNTFLQLNESAMTNKYPDFKRPGYHKWSNGMIFYDSMGYSSWRFITNDQDYVDEHGAIFDQSGKYDGMNDLVWEVTEVLNQLTPGNSRGIIFNVSAKPGKMIVVKIRALLPKGYELSGNAYNIGTIEASQGWLTSRVGTGVYKDYVYYVKYGNDVVEQGKRNNIWIRLYKDGGMNGQTEKWYITWAAVYNLTNATQDDLDGKYEYLRTNIQQTDAKIESTAERISYDLSMLSTAEMLNDDPTFRSSTGDLKPFNDVYGDPALTRVKQSSPNGSGYVLNIRHTASSYFRVYAGVRWDYPSRQDKKYVFRLTAKVPSGWRMAVHATAIGGGTQGWLEGTDLSGDGQWHDYFYIVQCGNLGNFDPVGRFGIWPESDTAVPAEGIEWQLCFAAAYDLTDETFRSETRTSIKQTADEIALTAERVDDAEAQLKVQADEINLKVSKEDYNGKEIKSLINMSPTGIRIQADQLDLIGAITISMLGGGLQNTINNIKEKANAAVPVDDFNDLLEDAIINGKTLIAGGFINTELINVNTLVARRIEAATGSFYSLTCINSSGASVGKITFNTSGQLTFEGDIMHQGNTGGRAYRFFAANIRCRGAFGAVSRYTAYIGSQLSSSYPSMAVYEYDELIRTVTLNPLTDSAGNTYYTVSCYQTDDDAAGVPLDTIAFCFTDTTTHRFLVDLQTHQRVTLVNLNDNDTGNYVQLYTNGKLVALPGGCALSAQKFMTSRMNPVNSNLGAGILFTSGQYDNNWR